jgi:hypothetical protein
MRGSGYGSKIQARQLSRGVGANCQDSRKGTWADFMISGSQMRAARCFLCWDRGDPAKASMIAVSIIEQIETTDPLDSQTFRSQRSAIRAAREADGKKFIENESAPGVRLHVNK